MELSEDIMDKIDRYLQGKMSSEEHSAFEADMNTNSELKKAIEDHKSLIFTIEAASAKDELNRIMNREKAKQGKTIGIRRSWMAVAASLAILVTSFFLIRNSGGGNQGLYAEFYQVDPGLPTTMSAESDVQFTEAMVLYKQGEYSRALAEFEKLATDQPASDTLLFYQGICHLELDQAEISAKLLKEVEASSTLFGEKAQWYRALSLLKSSDLIGAESILESISGQSGHRYFQEANLLKEKLED